MRYLVLCIIAASLYSKNLEFDYSSSPTYRYAKSFWDAEEDENSKKRKGGSRISAKTTIKNAHSFSIQRVPTSAEIDRLNTSLEKFLKNQEFQAQKAKLEPTDFQMQIRMQPLMKDTVL